MKCPACKNETKQKSYKIVNKFDSFNCGCCGHVYVEDRKLLTLDYTALYDEGFYDSYMGGIGYEQAYNETLKTHFQKKIAVLKKILPLGASILEIGSGPGFFASLMNDAGYVVTPVELTPGAQKYARKSSLKIEIISEDLNHPTCSVYGKKFDCVISWAVIEHIYDVDSFLELMRRYTKRNGYICIDTGIRTKVLSFFDIGYTSWLYPPLHLHVFSDRSIVKLFKNHGLGIVRFEPYFNFSTSRKEILIMHIKKIIKSFINIKKALRKNDPGKTAFIGLLIAKNI
jgi:SAM-dependent methyltransferase